MERLSIQLEQSYWRSKQEGGAVDGEDPGLQGNAGDEGRNGGIDGCIAGVVRNIVDAIEKGRWEQVVGPEVVREEQVVGPEVAKYV